MLSNSSGGRTVKLSAYVQEIEHAVTVVLGTVWSERKRLAELKEQVKKLEAAVEHGYQQARGWQDSDDPEYVAMGAGVYWQTYFNEDKQRHHTEQDKERLEQQIAVHSFSVAALAGNVLQYGKQGISIAFGGPDKCPKDGRMIGSQRLADVVWCGRNQALHWEDGKFTPKTEQCFQLLAKEVCSKFAEFEKGNQGLHLIHHLGWTDFDKFKADMLSLERADQPAAAST